MTKVIREVWIDAPRQKVWDVISDFGNVYLISPDITQSHITSAQETGLGATRHCDFNMMGANVEERIVGWDETHSLKIDVYQRKNLPMIKEMNAEFFLFDENGGTRLQAVMRYELSMGFIGSMMAAMMKPMYSKNWAAFAAGIKHYIETGEPIDGSLKLDTSPVIAVQA